MANPIEQLIRDLDDAERAAVSRLHENFSAARKALEQAIADLGEAVGNSRKNDAPAVPLRPRINQTALEQQIRNGGPAGAA